MANTRQSEAAVRRTRRRRRRGSRSRREDPWRKCEIFRIFKRDSQHQLHRKSLLCEPQHGQSRTFRATQDVGDPHFLSWELGLHRLIEVSDSQYHLVFSQIRHAVEEECCDVRNIVMLSNHSEFSLMVFLTKRRHGPLSKIFFSNSPAMAKLKSM